ncbi:septum formation protein Maf [Luminiphilus syltensis NOR5-1B]|uniref:Nucleoside triphosphate pyrophosphatase n=1 Tax=Luminiphilus syltensis NOR5-1B TaxID=565045 RepID=B8KR94_9GAMM|nr:septum formation protein Maf [Luminiphilus syltensis NOR5-1B]
MIDVFECRPADIDESPLDDELPSAYVERLARAKAHRFAADDRLVLAADTTVVRDSDLLGKPLDKSHARRMLQSLSGRAHHVWTAVAIAGEGRIDSRTVCTEVSFATLSESLIDAYLATDEPWDKAGSYGIQGLAGCFVSAVRGSYSAVVGLPLCETRQLLTSFDILPHWVASADG